MTSNTSPAVTRRALLATSLVLSACGPNPTSPSQSPTDAPEPPECVSLGRHNFHENWACEYQYGHYPQQTDSNDTIEFDPTTFFGPVRETKTGFSAAIVNVFAQWDLTVNQVSGLIAPRISNSTVHAVFGNLAAVPACDGSVLIYESGCYKTTCQGHTRIKSTQRPIEGQQGSDGIQDLAFLDDTVLISIGVDNTLRNWDTKTGSLSRTRELTGATTKRRIFHTDGWWLCEENRVERFDPETLETIELFDKLPSAPKIWRPSKGKLISQPKSEDSLLQLDVISRNISTIDVKIEKPWELFIDKENTIIYSYLENKFLKLNSQELEKLEVTGANEPQKPASGLLSTLHNKLFLLYPDHEPALLDLTTTEITKLQSPEIRQ